MSIQRLKNEFLAFSKEITAEELVRNPDVQTEITEIRRMINRLCQKAQLRKLKQLAKEASREISFAR